MGAHGYVVTNQLTGLATSAFTWSTGGATNKAYLNDGRMDSRQVIGASVASGINLVVNFGSAKALTGWAVLNSNAGGQKTDATLRIRAADDAGMSVNVVTAKAASTLYSTTSPKNKDHVVQFASVTKQYWELLWTWTGNVTNFAIGELFAYTALTALSRRSIYGSGETHEALVAQSLMGYGETRGLYLAGPIRQPDLNWDDLNATERDQLHTMHELSFFGASPLLWVESQEATALAAAAAEQECIYGRLMKPGYRWTQTDFGIYQPDGFSLRSCGREAGA